MAKEISTSRVPKSDYINYLKKAEEFLASAQDNLIRDRWNAAGLNAIHVGISSADALLVSLHGIKSTSPKHDDILKLFPTLVKQSCPAFGVAPIRMKIPLNPPLPKGEK